MPTLPQNAELERALSLYDRNPSPMGAMQLYRALLKATLLASSEGEVKDSGGVDWGSMSTSSKQSFRMLKDGNGRVALPVFTDPKLLFEKFPKGKVIAARAVDIARLLGPTSYTVVINPGPTQPSGIHIPRAALKAIAQGKVPQMP